MLNSGQSARSGRRVCGKHQLWTDTLWTACDGCSQRPDSTGAHAQVEPFGVRVRVDMKLALATGLCIGNGFVQEACADAPASAVGMHPKACNLPVA